MIKIIAFTEKSIVFNAIINEICHMQQTDSLLQPQIIMENSSYIIHQFEDKGLAHYSYAILSEGEIALIDPARDPQPYYDFAEQNDARIVAVIETHPHADFVSSHLEIASS